MSIAGFCQGRKYKARAKLSLSGELSYSRTKEVPCINGRLTFCACTGPIYERRLMYFMFISLNSVVADAPESIMYPDAPI